MKVHSPEKSKKLHASVVMRITFQIASQTTEKI
jgi:hypothetical protein